MEEYLVYVKVNAHGFITAVASSGFLRDTEGWTEIDRGSGERYYHAQPRYLPGHILTESGVWRYKLADGVPVECTSEEIAAQEKAQIAFPTSNRNITAGEYVVANGILFKATANIPNGGYIITGQNAKETTLEEQLNELASGG